MNDEKQVVKLAAERLLAVANGATLEWANGRDDGQNVDICIGHSVGLWGSDRVRIRPPAVAPEPRPSLPCPPRPTPDQVAAARMPDGRRVKEPTVCEVPNGRAWFDCESSVVLRASCGPAPSLFDGLRWIAEPADAVVEPWTVDTVPMPLVVRQKGHSSLLLVNMATKEGVLFENGADPLSYADLLRECEQRNGQPCGVAK